MKHLDELTATLRMILMFLVVLLGVCWGAAKLFLLMGMPPGANLAFSIVLTATIGIVLAAKWRALQEAPAREQAQKPAESTPSEDPDIIVDQLETGQLVLAREHKKKAARSFRVPKSSFVSVLDGLPRNYAGEHYLIQQVSGRLLCVKRVATYWEEEGSDGVTVFDSDREVVRYARIDTSKPAGPRPRPPLTAGTPHDTIKFWAPTGGCLVTLATGQTKWVKQDIRELGEHAGLWRSIQGWGPKHGPFTEVCDGLPEQGVICLVELDDGTRAVRERPSAGNFWASPADGETFFDPGAIASYRGPFVVRYAELIGTHITKRKLDPA